MRRPFVIAIFLILAVIAIVVLKKSPETSRSTSTKTRINIASNNERISESNLPGVERDLKNPTPGLVQKPSSLTVWFEIEVRDALGGVIEGASIRWLNKMIGVSDENGRVKVFDEHRFDRFSSSAGQPSPTLEAFAEGYASASIRLDEEPPPALVRIRLFPESTIRGRVFWKHNETPAAQLEISSESRTTRSDAQGNFLLDRLEPGRYRLIARGEHAYGASDFVVLGVGESIEDLRIEVETAYCISGRVLADGRVPKSPPHLEIQGRAVSIGQDGSFLVCGVPPGRHIVNIQLKRSHGFYALHPSYIVNLRDHDETLNIDLGARNDITVEMVNSEGIVVPDVIMTASMEVQGASTVTLPCTSNQNGRCLFRGVPKGSLQIVSKNGLFAPQAFAIPSSDLFQVVVEPPVATLRGQLLDRSGVHPIGGRIVGLESQSGQRYHVYSTSIGRFQFSALPVGEYQLSVYRRNLPAKSSAESQAESPSESPAKSKKDQTKSSSHHEETISVTTHHSNTEKKVLLPVDLCEIQGRVVDPAGGPIVDAEIEVNSDEQVPGRAAVLDHFTLSDEEGRFRLSSLPKGDRIQVRAHHREYGKAKVNAVVSEMNELQLQLPGVGRLRVKIRGEFPCRILVGKDHVYVEQAVASNGAIFDALPPGEVEIRAECADSIRREARSNIKLGQTAEIYL